MDATLLTLSSSNLLNDTQTNVLASSHPGQKGIIFSETLLDYFHPHTPPEREKTLSVQSLQERAKTPCVQSLQERAKTPCAQSLQERAKTPCVQSLQEREKTPCTKSVIPVGGRLGRFLTQWEHQGAHRSILSLPRDGYKLPFRERPNLSMVPCITSGYAGSDRQSALLTSIQDLLHKGAIEVVHTQNSLGFYSRLFLVPKPGNCWRPVIDLSSVNKFLVIPKFKMETPESIRASLRKGEWVTSIALTDAYLHVPIHTHSEKYLRFHHKGITYQFVSLPFGLATAPLVFTSLVKEVKLLALQQGIRLQQYLDDWLIRAPSKEECHSRTQALLSLVKDLGFVVNLKKSELRDSQRFDFLGYHFLLDLALVRPTQDRWTKLQEMFHRLSKKSVISARTLMSTTGLLASTEKTVKLGRMHMRPFQWHLKNHWKYSMPLDTPVPWNQKMIQHGEWWLDQQNVLQGEFLHPSGHEKLIFTYVSNAGWGAHSGQDSTGGLSSHLEKHLRINLLEMKAVFLALQFFKKTKQSSPHRLRQHLSGGIHQQTGPHSISRTLWPNVENPNMVQSEQCDTQSTTHPRITQCNSGRPLQEEPDPINRMVPLSTNLQTNFQTLGESASGPIHNQPEHKTPSLRLSNSRPSGMGCGCPEHSMGKPGCVHFPSHRPAAQGCTKTPIPDL